MEYESAVGKVGNAHKTRGERTPIRTHTKKESPHRAVRALPTRVRVAGCKTCDGTCSGFWEGLGDWVLRRWRRRLEVWTEMASFSVLAEQGWQHHGAEEW